MADNVLGAPVRVSPLIKFGRWSFLLAGVFYGMSRHAALSKKETALREIEERERPAKEAKLKLERERLSREGVLELEKAFGMAK